MLLFADEHINISKIYTVNMYEHNSVDIKTRHYSTKMNTYELIFFISGKNHTIFCDKKIDDVPNSIRFLPKGNFSGSYEVIPIENVKCIDIYFDTSDPLPDCALSIKDIPELKTLFIKIFDIWNSNRTGYYSKSMCIFYEIIWNIKNHNSKYFTNEQSKKILQSYNYILEHYTEKNFNYKKMCFYSGLSYDYFKELFIKQYGAPPIKIITSMRIEKAKELLITGQYTIAQISKMCGFNNANYFSTVFKKHTGISPSNF